MYYWGDNKKKKFEKPHYTLSDKRKETKTAVCLLSACLSNYPNEEERRELNEIAQRHGEEMIWLDSHKSHKEERLREVLRALEASNRPYRIKNKYDYAWIKLAIDSEIVNGFRSLMNCSFPESIHYLDTFGLRELPEPTAMRKYYDKAYGTFPWMYRDCVNNLTERNRRNGIVNKFRELMEA